jgi:hypothetical protein
MSLKVLTCFGYQGCASSRIVCLCCVGEGRPPVGSAGSSRGHDCNWKLRRWAHNKVLMVLIPGTSADRQVHFK